MLKNKDFKTIFCSAGNQSYQRKVVPQLNLVIPPVVNRLISVGELRPVAIKHPVELSVEHDFFCHFFSKRKTCHDKVTIPWPLFCDYTLLTLDTKYSISFIDVGPQT